MPTHDANTSITIMNSSGLNSAHDVNQLIYVNVLFGVTTCFHSRLSILIHGLIMATCSGIPFFFNNHQSKSIGTLSYTPFPNQ